MKKFQFLFSNFLIILGTFVTIYNGLNFAQGNSADIKYGLADKVVYFYTPNVRLNIAIGVSVLLVGIFLKRKNKQ